MELIPTLICASGFGLALAYVLIVHKVISSGERRDTEEARQTSTTGRSAGEPRKLPLRAHAH